MDRLFLKGTDDTPEVNFDKNDGRLELSGRSLPENAAEFYAPLISWLHEYTETPNPQSVVIVRLEYFNTASSKMLLDMLSILENLPDSIVLWHYDPEDEDMRDAGDVFSELVDIKFRLVPIEVQEEE